MIDGERLLGALIKQGLTGSRSSRRRRSSSGLESLLGSPGKVALGMGALGVAIAAFEHFTQSSSGGGSQPSPPASHTAGRKAPPPPPGSPEPDARTAPTPPPVPGGTPAVERAISDQQLLLIRAMIASANADGIIDESERAAIVNYLEEAGLNKEERDFIEQELASPKSLDWLLPQVKDEEVANQFYAVSLLAVEVDSEAERAYLRYLRARLGVDDKTAQGLHDQFGLPLEQ